MANTSRQELDAALALMVRGRTDELVDMYYHADAVLIASGRTVQGHKALKMHFRALAMILGSYEVISIDAFTEGEDSILLEKTIQTALGKSRVYDAFVLNNRKITHHFSGCM